MKGADFPGLTPAAPSAARNGTHRTTKKSRPALKGPPVPDAISATALATAAFAAAEAEPIDAPMWPLHAALWLQLEMAPSIPVWTGLAIERHNRIPAPDFLRLDAAPADRPGTLLNPAFSSGKSALSPPARPDLPASGLTPLGWDPRSVCRKQGGL
jgi:hypothetical protein